MQIRIRKQPYNFAGTESLKVTAKKLNLFFLAFRPLLKLDLTYNQ